MDSKELKSQYDKLLKDLDFDKLELGLKNPNIFEILRISKKEIRHSNFLSWLLDPNESHKLGDVFLKRFLREVASSERFNLDQADIEGMDFSNAEIRREWRHIDILIVLSDTVVCVENKVLSKEHSDQLKRYKDVVEKEFPKHNKVFVFLTPEGEEAENDSDSYEPISYGFIVETLERIVSVYDESLSPQVRNYVKDYITVIKRELMDTDELSELSRKIYNNHKGLFDFVYDHKPDLVDNLRYILEQEIKNRGWIIGSRAKNYLRFTTPKISELTYTNKSPNGWVKRESFLFEFVLYPDRDSISRKTVISPSDSDYNTSRLSEIFSEIDGSKTPSGKKWLCHFVKNEKFPFSKTDEMTDEEIAKSFNKVLDSFSPLIQKFEDKYVEHELELQEMKLNASA